MLVKEEQNLSDLFETRAHPVTFVEVNELISLAHKEWRIERRYYDSDTVEFLSTFQNFFKNQLQIDGLKHHIALPSYGTTGAFNTFYLLNHDRTLLLLPGEYSYHEHLMTRMNRRMAVWNLERPKDPSFLILSLPFSGDGNLIPNFEEILILCEKFEIPVLLDLSFFALTEKPIHLLDFNCIKAISFSLSKIYDVGNFRIGVTYWRRDLYTPENLMREWTYENHFSSFLALRLLREVPPQELTKRALPLQRKICRDHGLTPSDTYLFGLSSDPKWANFFRKEDVARICITRLINQELQRSAQSGL